MPRLGETFAGTAVRFADRPAVVCGERVTRYADLSSFAAGLCGLLRNRRIGPEHPVAILADRKDDYLRSTFGLLVAGVPAVPVDSSDASGAAEVIGNIQPRLVICQSALEPSLRARFPAAEFLAVGDVEAATNNGVSALPYDPGMDAIALILHTSGTEGARKGVMISQGSLAFNTDYLVGFMELSKAVVEYACAPVTHAFGLGRFRAVLSVGGTLVLDDGPFNPMRLLAALQQHRCNAISSVATGLALVAVKMPQALLPYCDQVRWIEIGSVPVSQDSLDKLCTIFPRTKLVVNYGMTEAMRSTMIDINVDSSKRSSVGRPSPGTEVRIIDDAGRPLDPGAAGTIQVRGKHLATSYWGREHDWLVRTRDGWFATDDRGWVDVDGYLHFVCRRDDVINIGGEKVSPLIIEDAIRALISDHPFCVIGMCDKSGLYGDIPVLVLEGPHSISWDSLRSSLINSLPRSLIPRITVDVPSFPRASNGKIRRNALRKLLQ